MFFEKPNAETINGGAKKKKKMIEDSKNKKENIIYKTMDHKYKWDKKEALRQKTLKMKEKNLYKKYFRKEMKKKTRCSRKKKNTKVR